MPAQQNSGRDLAVDQRAGCRVLAGPPAKKAAGHTTSWRTVSDLSGRTTVVVGASRGLGRRGIATAFAAAGAWLVAVSRPRRRSLSRPAAPAPSSRRS
jgi:hypothetical protein